MLICFLCIYQLNCFIFFFVAIHILNWDGFLSSWRTFFNISFSGNLLMMNIWEVFHIWKVFIYLYFFKKNFVIKFQLTSFHIKHVSLLFLLFLFFQWKICCYPYLYFSLCNTFLSLAAFNIFIPGFEQFDYNVPCCNFL